MLKRCRSPLDAGGSARRTTRGEFEGQQNEIRWEFQEVDKSLCREERSADIKRAGRMVLDPLTEVGVGVLVPVVIGSRQLVMNVLRHGKRRKSEQQQDKAERHSVLKNGGQTSYGSAQSHCWRAT